MAALGLFWREITIAALLAVGFFGYNYYSKSLEIAELKLEIAETESNSWKERFNNLNNRIMEDYKINKERADDIFNRLDNTLEEHRETSSELVTRIENIPVPESCENMQEYYNEIIGMIKWQD